MKKTLFIATLIIFLFQFQEAKAQNFRTTFDPIASDKDAGYGFYADFDFTVLSYDMNNMGAANILLNSLKVDLAKGYYRKFYSQPKGKFYNCTQLKGLCDQTEAIGFWIRVTWEYNGTTYQNGSQFTGRQKGAEYEYVGISNSFTPPSEIPVKDRNEGKVKVKNISISSCSFNTTDKIEDIIRSL